MTYFSRQAADEPEPKRIGFVGFDGASSFDLLGSLEAFSAARTAGSQGVRRRCYEAVVIGLNGRSFVSNSGAVIKAHHTTDSAPLFDTIIIPGGDGLRNSEAGRKIAEWLIVRARNSRRIAAISAGIYPLASTGLLNGTAVTTHWRLANDVARSFPALSVSSAISFVKAGAFYTCGGGISGMEMSPALIEEDYGARTAVAVARELSLDLRPAGSEQQAALPDFQPRARGTARGIAHLDDDPTAPQSDGGSARGKGWSLAASFLPAFQRDVQENAGAVRGTAAHY